MDVLHRISEALIVYETLEANEINDLVDGRALTREPPKVRMTTREEVDKRQAIDRERKKADAGGIVGLEPSKA